MGWFFPRKAEYTDGAIDLIPVYLPPSDWELGFEPEREWKITEHGKRKEIGRVTYRAGESEAIYYFGHIGYHIDPPYRGHHYALRACRLIREEILRSGKSSVIITCDPDNEASRKTCLGLGCLWEGQVPVAEWLQKKYDISDRKDRFIWTVIRG